MLKQPTAPVLLGLTGGPAAGKDTVASLLVQNHGFITVGFSDALRDFMYATDHGFRMAVDTFGYVEAKASTHGLRERMIEVGTAAREWISPTIWVDAVERRVNNAMDNDQSVVVTGVRYTSELAFIHKLGGQVIGVDRPGVEFENDTYYDTFLRADDYVLNHFGIDHLADEVSSLIGGVPGPSFRVA